MGLLNIIQPLSGFILQRVIIYHRQSLQAVACELIQVHRLSSTIYSNKGYCLLSITIYLFVLTSLCFIALATISNDSWMNNIAGEFRLNNYIIQVAVMRPRKWMKRILYCYILSRPPCSRPRQLKPWFVNRFYCYRKIKQRDKSQ